MIHAERLALPWWQAVTAGLDDLEVVDPHLHVGLDDPSGFLATADDVLDGLALVGGRGAVFPLKEPHRSYREANAAVLDLVDEHPDRLVALARLDPADDPVGTLTAALDRGARGIKLHPRGEDFDADDPRLDDVFAIADERRLMVLVHDGAGVGDQGPLLLARAAEHRGMRLVLAHAATRCFQAVVPNAHEHPNLFFDTSWWNPTDVLALMQLVGPGRVLCASDVPFCSPAMAFTVTARIARQCGYDDDALRSLLGGQAGRLLDGEEPLDLGGPPASGHDVPPELHRLAFTLGAALERMLGGDEPGQGMELAEAACRQGADAHPAFGAVLDLLHQAQEQDEPDGRRVQRAPGWDLVYLAAVVAMTPAAGVP